MFHVKVIISETVLKDEKYSHEQNLGITYEEWMKEKKL